MDAGRLGGGAPRSFRWDEPRERPGVIGRVFARAATAGFAVLALLLVLARLVPFFHGTLFFVSLVLVFGAVACVVLLDRRSVTVDERGITVDEFLGRLPARTIPFEKMGRAELEGTLPQPGKARPARRPAGSTLHVSAPDANGRTGSDILAVSLADDVDAPGLLAALRRYGVEAGVSEGNRLRRSTIPTPIALIVFPVAIAGTALWSATRPDALAIARRPAIACATLDARDTVELQVTNFVPAASVTVGGFNAKEPDVSVGPLEVSTLRDPKKPPETNVTFRATGLVPRHLYALTLTTAAGPTMIPFLAIPVRRQGVGC